MKHLYNDDFTPRRATKDSAGYDIFIDRDIEISNKEYTKIDTNVVFEGTEFRRTGPYDFPRRYDNFINWVAIIAPRSSYGMKYGLHFSNTIGIIDKDYRDNIILHARVTTDEPNLALSSPTSSSMLTFSLSVLLIRKNLGTENSLHESHAFSVPT